MLQSITTCWPLLCLNREGSLHLMHGKTWWLIQDKFYKSKTSSCFPIFDASNTWQMDFAAWLDLTSNANNTITVYQLTSKFQNTFWFFKTCWWLTGLSRLYDGSQPPDRHTRYFKTMLKILVDRALMQHISFLFYGILFDAQSIHVLCSRHNNRCKQSVPRIPLYMLWDLILTPYTINSLPVCCSTNKLLKTWLGKAKLFAYVLTRKQSKNQRHKYRTMFFYYIEDHMQKFG